MALAGHLWTLAPRIVDALVPLATPAPRPWSTTVDDPRVGRVVLRGLLHGLPDADAVVVIVHGLGGSPESDYCRRAARAAHAAGLASLRLALRGADLGGDDFYHAGLTRDLRAAIDSDALAPYDTVFLLGYSLGGHVALRAGLAPSLPRVRAIASVCAPLDLAAASAALDAPHRWPYRRHVLAGLREAYGAVARKRDVPTPLAVIRRITTIREWDRHTIVPHHGFFSVDDYYARMSVGPRLARLEVPALCVIGTDDPMVPAWTLTPSLADAPPHLEARRVRGGHVGFPPGARVEDHVMAWLADRRGR